MLLWTVEAILKMIAYHPRAYLPWAARTAVRASSHCDCHSETQGHKRWLALREGDDLVGSRPSNSTHQLSLFSTFFESIKTPKWVWDVFFSATGELLRRSDVFSFLQDSDWQASGAKIPPLGEGSINKRQRRKEVCPVFISGLTARRK